MGRFNIGEYIRNVGYNLVSVLLLAVTFIACTIFLSNISAQQKMNRFLKPYLNEKSIIIGQLHPDFDVTSLTKYEKSIMTREIFCISEDVGDLKECIVYNDYSMDKLTPRLKDGELIDKRKSEDDVMQVLISENEMGIGTGDVIEVEFYGYDGEPFLVMAKISGVIASGQKLMLGNGVEISKTMDSSDILGTYSYEQLCYAIIITTEEEFEKLSEPVYETNFRCIVKFDDSITKEERLDNYNKIIDIEHKYGNVGTEIFPEMERLVIQQREEMRVLMIKYVPLTVAVSVLIGACIICMVSIKNANSMRYYATLYICGMPYKKAVIMSGIEMFVNCIMAVFLTVSFVILQSKLFLVGEINCELDMMQAVIIAGISLVIVFSTMILTANTLRERSAMDVLRDTAY